MVVRSFFGDIELSKIEGFELFSYANNLFELSTQSSMTLFALLMRANFYRYNLRKIDREVKEQIGKFEKFAREKILNHI